MGNIGRYFTVANVRSGVQGRFEIRGLWPGRYELQFQASASTSSNGQR